MRTLLALPLVVLRAVPSPRAADEGHPYDEDLETLLKTAYFGLAPLA